MVENLEGEINDKRLKYEENKFQRNYYIGSVK